jgi:hypothetical protein
LNLYNEKEKVMTQMVLPNHPIKLASDILTSLQAKITINGKGYSSPIRSVCCVGGFEPNKCPDDLDIYIEFSEKIEPIYGILSQGKIDIKCYTHRPTMGFFPKLHKESAQLARHNMNFLYNTESRAFGIKKGGFYIITKIICTYIDQAWGNEKYMELLGQYHMNCMHKNRIENGAIFIFFESSKFRIDNEIAYLSMPQPSLTLKRIQEVGYSYTPPSEPDFAYIAFQEHAKRYALIRDANRSRPWYINFPQIPLDPYSKLPYLPIGMEMMLEYEYNNKNEHDIMNITPDWSPYYDFQNGVPL